MSRRKLAPDVIRGGYRFDDKDMRQFISDRRTIYSPRNF
jgi:hypothetical protein